MKTKVIIISALILNFYTVMAVSKGDSHFVVSLENNYVVILNDLKQNSKITLFTCDLQDGGRNLKDLRITKAQLLDVEDDRLKIIIYQYYSSFFSESVYCEYAFIYIYNIKSKSLELKQKFIRRNDIDISSEVLIGDNANKYLEHFTSIDFSNYFFYYRTNCFNGYLYYLQSGIRKTSCSNHYYALGKLRKEKKSTLVTKGLEYQGGDKLLGWGFMTLDASSDGRYLLADFCKERHHFNWERRSSPIEIIEYNTVTYEEKRIIDFACNPSYSNDDKYILFDQVYQPFGFTKFNSEGYHIYERSTGKITFFNNCKYAVFVK
jgi:hypothetical protein